VNRAGSATAFTTSANPSSNGQAVTFTATVSSAAGTPTGTVTISDGATALATITLVHGSASFTTSALALGTHSITAGYSGDGNYSGSTSTALSQTVNSLAISSVALASSANPAFAGQAFTLTATVSAAPPATGTPTGTVTFMDGGTVLGTGTLSGGVAALTTSTLTPGSHTLTASYGGNSSFNGNTSTALSQTIWPATTASFFASDTTTKGSWRGTYGSQGYNVIDNAASYPSYAQVSPTGQSDFVWSASTTDVRGLQKAGAATDRIAATWYSASNFTVDVNLTDNQLHKASLYLLDWDSSGRSERVDVLNFFNGAVLDSRTVTQFTNGIWLSWNVSGFVQFRLTNTSSANAVLSGLFFDQPLVLPVPSVALSSSSNPSTYGQAVTLRATVSAVPPATGTPTGTVTFMDGAAALGTGTLSAGVATLTTSTLTAGTHTITAVYGGDSNFAGASSSALSQVVNRANTSTALTSSVNPSANGQAVTFTATITTAAGAPTGTVTFADGATTLATITLSGGSAAFTTSTLAVGSHSITAAYGGDNNFTGSTSTALSQTVNSQAASSTTLTSSANPAPVGQAITLTATVSAVPPATGTPTGTVTFMDGVSVLGTGTLSGGVATLTTSTLTAGTHSITAVYGGNRTFNGSTSPALSQTITGVTSASFVGSDTTTQGTWRGTYGAQGYNVIDNASSYPSYVQLTPSGQQDYVWSASTTDVRALQKAAPATDRIAATWFASSSFSVDLNLTDGGTHQIALYLLDFDGNNRSERIDVINPANSNVLNSQTLSSFSGGTYLLWNISGHVQFRITTLAGGNCVLSGLFIDALPVVSSRSPAPGASNVSTATTVTVTFTRAMNGSTITPSTFTLRVGTGNPVPATVSYSGNTAVLTPNAALAVNTTYTATLSGTVTDSNGNPIGSDIVWSFTTQSNPPTASFLRTDTTTQGTWRGTYGSSGYNVIDNASSYPSYAQVSASGQQDFIWSASTTDVRALQKAAPATDRIAATWFSSSSFTVDLNLTDGNTHRIALYLLDFDSNTRSERIDVINPVNGNVLNSQTLSSFNGGTYLLWNISGHVQFRITSLAGGNCVLSGLFID
jgi:hypothetical protein